MLFVIFIRELGATILLYAQGTETISVAIVLLSENSSAVAALAVIQLVLLLGAFTLFRLTRFASPKLNKERAGWQAMAAFAGPRSVKRFGDPAAVDGVSFEVGEGHTLALLGPSGCGKTTILRFIAGLETPEYGSIDDRRQSRVRQCSRIDLCRRSASWASCSSPMPCGRICR